MNARRGTKITGKRAGGDMENETELKQGWRFLPADAFPMAEAVEKHRDAANRSPLDADYDDRAW